MGDEKIDNKIEELENRLEKVERVVFSKKEEPTTLEDKKKELADKMDVEVEGLEKVIDFEADRPYILPEIPGDTQKEKQQNFATLFLVVMKHCYGTDSIEARELVEIVKNRGFYNTKFGNNLKSHRPYLRQIGKTKSPKSSYKITHPKGTNKGLELLNTLISST